MHLCFWWCALASAHTLLLLGCSAQTIKGLAPLTDANFTEVFEDEWVVLFHTPWCVSCGDILPEWTDFAQKASRFGIQVAVCDMTAYPGVAGRFFALNSLQAFYVVNGEARLLPESVNAPKLLQYLRDRRWTTIAPLPWWRAPDRRHMVIVAGFFYVAEEFRTILTDVSSRYNLKPFWLYIAIFSVSILLGILAGVILVIVADVTVATMRRASAVCRHTRRLSIEFIRSVCRCPNETATAAASTHKEAEEAWMLYWSRAGQSDEGNETCCTVQAVDREEMDAAMCGDMGDNDAFLTCTAVSASPRQQSRLPMHPQQSHHADMTTTNDQRIQGDHLTSPTVWRAVSMGPDDAVEAGLTASPLEQGDTIALSLSHNNHDVVEVQHHFMDKTAST